MLQHNNMEIVSCIGCGLCAESCPDVFEMDDDGKAGASENEIEEKLMDDTKEAEAGCPAGAITIE